MPAMTKVLTAVPTTANKKMGTKFAKNIALFMWYPLLKMMGGS